MGTCGTVPEDPSLPTADPLHGIGKQGWHGSSVSAIPLPKDSCELGSREEDAYDIITSENDLVPERRSRTVRLGQGRGEGEEQFFFFLF